MSDMPIIVIDPDYDTFSIDEKGRFYLYELLNLEIHPDFVGLIGWANGISSDHITKAKRVDDIAIPCVYELQDSEE